MSSVDLSRLTAIVHTSERPASVARLVRSVRRSTRNCGCWWPTTAASRGPSRAPTGFACPPTSAWAPPATPRSPGCARPTSCCWKTGTSSPADSHRAAARPGGPQPARRRRRRLRPLPAAVRDLHQPHARRRPRHVRVRRRRPDAAARPSPERRLAAGRRPGPQLLRRPHRQGPLDGRLGPATAWSTSGSSSSSAPNGSASAWACAPMSSPCAGPTHPPRSSRGPTRDFTSLALAKMGVSRLTDAEGRIRRSRPRLPRRVTPSGSRRCPRPRAACSADDCRR